MAPSDIWICIDGYDEREKLEWERMRELAYWIHVHSMATKKARSPQKFRPLPWDEEAKKTKVESLQEIMDDYRKRKAQRKLDRNGGSDKSTDSR